MLFKTDLTVTEPQVCTLLIKFQSTDIPDADFILRDHMEEINRLFDGDTVEEIFSNLEKEGSEWALKQLNTLKKMVSTVTVLGKGYVHMLYEQLAIPM